MKSRRRVSRSLIFASAFASILFALYLQFGLLPGGLKNWAIREIEAVTDVRIRFKRLLILPFIGAGFHELQVWDKQGNPLFSAKRLSVDVKLLPFLQENKIVVRNVYLDSPIYDFCLKSNKITVAPAPIKTKISGQIEVPVAGNAANLDLAASIEGGPEMFLPENVYLEQIEIVNGIVTVRERPGAAPIETIHSINIRMAYQKPPLLGLSGFFHIGSPKSYSTVNFNGHWDLERSAYEFYLKTISGKTPDWLVAYQKNSPLILKKGGFVLKAHLLSSTEEKVLFHTQADLSGAELSLKKTGIAGHVRLDARGIFDFESRKFSRYQGWLDFIDVNLSNISPEIAALDRINGRMRFKTDELSLESIRGEFKELPFVANARILSFANLLLDGEIETNSSIAQLLALLPDDQKKLLKDFQIQGNCRAITVVKGSLKNPVALEKKHKLLITQGALQSSDGKMRLANLRSQVAIDTNGFRISKARFTLDKKPYYLDAFIPQTPSQPGTAKLRSKGLEFSAVYTVNGDTMAIREGSAFYQGITARFNGTLSDLRRPYLDLNGRLKTDLENIKPMLDTHVPALKDAGLGGELSGNFILKGHWNNPVDWQFKIDAAANPLFVKQTLKLDGFEVQIRLQNRLLDIPYIHASPYGGVIGGRVLFDFSRQGTQGTLFDAKIHANNLDLGAAAKDFDPSLKNFSGIALFQTSLSGFLNDPSTFRGEGAVHIQNGRLWETNLFKKMGELLFIKVEEMDVVVFHTLSATFRIQEERIWSRDLTLNSNTVDLGLIGSAGFDGSLDFLMNIQYSKDVMRGAMQTGGLVPFVIEQAGELISKYRIRGTLKEPKYEKTPLPVAQVLGKKISTIFQTLGQ